MFEIKSRELVIIDPGYAAKLLNINTYEKQRPLSVSHVHNLCEAIKSGEFHSGEIAIAVDELTGKQTLMNGQHQLNAVLQSGKPIHATITVATCSTISDESNFFSQFDVHKARSIADVVRSEIHSLNVDWNKRTGPLMAHGLAILAGSKCSETKHHRARRVSKHINAGDFVNQFMSSDNKHLHRGPVVSGIIATYFKDADDALIFWNAVASGEMLAKNDQRLKLRTFLVQSSGSSGRKTAATIKEIRSKINIAWNAWRKGVPTNLKYSAENRIPRLV